jgi:hypothetical protein
MDKRTIVCASAFVLAMPLWASDVLSGKWILQPGKGTFSGWAQYEREGDSIRWTTPAGTNVVFKLDGKDYPGPSPKTTMVWKRIDKNTIELTTKRDGVVTSTGQMTFSPDGTTRTLTSTSKDSEGSGKEFVSTVTAKRIGGPTDRENPLIGRWQTDPTTAKGSFPPLIIEAKADGIRVQSSPSGYEAKFDGKEYPLRSNFGDDRIVVSRIDERTVQETRRAGDNVRSTSTLSVSADGKTLTVTTKRGEVTGTSVYKRE